MSEDWKPGDLAVCVDVSTRDCGAKRHNGRCVRVGLVIKVLDVEVMPCGCISLRNGTTIANNGFGPLASRFRKIKPDQHEPCEAEFRILLNLSKRRVKA